MRVNKKYTEQAKNLLECNFGVYGVGNFDVSVKELAHILFLMDNKKWHELREFYNKLHEEIFGCN